LSRGYKLEPQATQTKPYEFLSFYLLDVDKNEEADQPLSEDVQLFHVPARFQNENNSLQYIEIVSN
jgi:hypothetical protein